MPDDELIAYSKQELLAVGFEMKVIDDLDVGDQIPADIDGNEVMLTYDHFNDDTEEYMFSIEQPDGFTATVPVDIDVTPSDDEDDDQGEVNGILNPNQDAT